MLNTPSPSAKATNAPAPSISIIMNCYNNAETLTESFQSVMAQTFTNWEVIFYDNGSHDDSLNIAQSFATKCDKIFIFQDDDRISLGHSRNMALAKAKGEYIAFLDCDDIWLPNKLEKQIKLMQYNPNLALICTDAENFYVKNHCHKSLGCIFNTAKPHRGKVFSKLISGQWVAMSSVLLRHDYLRTQNANGMYFDTTLNICEEAELFYRLANTWDFDYINETLTKRRIHASNITFTRFDELAAETEYILKKQFEIYADFHKTHADIVKILSQRAAFQKAIGLWLKGQGNNARKALQGCKSLKAKLFYVVSFLPPSFFPLCARAYLKFSKYINS